MYIPITDPSRIHKVNTAGIITTFAGGGTSTAEGSAATDFQLRGPYGVAVDSSGAMLASVYLLNHSADLLPMRCIYRQRVHR